VLSASGSGYDPSYCNAIKCDTTINISGSTITTTSTGVGGKGISSDAGINISGGTVNVTNSGAGATYTNSSAVLDAYSGAGIDADSNISITGGNVTVISSGTAAKGISSDADIVFGSSATTPTVNVTNTGTKLLVSGTANYTTAVYAEPKAIKADGNISFNSGTYTLSVSQQGANVIDSDGALTVTGGVFTVTVGGNQSKGLKSTGTMTLNGGTIGITTTGGVTLENVAAATYNPSYCSAIKGDGVVNVGGSSITINGSGAGNRGISADGNLNITSGSVNITNSGAGATYTNSSSTTDAYSACCITSDANILITNGTITLSASGSGGKTLKVDGTLTIGDSSGAPTINLTTTGAKFTVGTSSSGGTGGGPGGGGTTNTDYCHPKTIVTDGAITINNGNLTISSTDDGIHSEKSITINGGNTIINSSVEGIESLTITINGGYVSVVGSDDGINATAGAVAGGSEYDDGSYFYMKGGILVVSATSGDAVDSNGGFAMTGGVLASFGPANSTNEDIDANGSITVNGGLLFGGCYNSSMFETISSTSQVGVNVKSSTTIASAGSYIRIQDASGTEIGTFITPRAAYYFHFSSPSMKKGTTYNIYTGGSYTGGTTYGNSSKGAYCTGGTYSNGSLKKTFTTSSSAFITTTN
jgi:hypothetical protein